MVKTKASYAQFLLTHKRARDFAGVEIDPPPFNPVEDIHHEMRGKVMASMFDWMAKGR